MAGQREDSVLSQRGPLDTSGPTVRFCGAEPTRRQMNREDFGRLIASLRKEHEDDDGNSWNQETLAREANAAAGADLFSEDIVGRIERGNRLRHRCPVLCCR